MNLYLAKKAVNALRRQQPKYPNWIGEQLAYCLQFLERAIHSYQLGISSRHDLQGLSSYLTNLEGETEDMMQLDSILSEVFS
jgi:hypothetical protein